jgi:hypothetical protein
MHATYSEKENFEKYCVNYSYQIMRSYSIGVIFSGAFAGDYHIINASNRSPKHRGRELPRYVILPLLSSTWLCSFHQRL